MTDPDYVAFSLQDHEIRLLDQALRLYRKHCLAEYKAAPTVRERDDWSIDQETCSALHDRLRAAHDRLLDAKEQRTS